MEILGRLPPEYSTILTPEALAFIGRLQREFGPRRRALLNARAKIQVALDAGERPDFPPSSGAARATNWTVAPIPADLQDRRVEITGPTDRKMMINALNSGASVFMADFEDANSPTWDNMIHGHINLRDAIAGTISFDGPDGRQYRLNEQAAVLKVRPRGWHLPERHVMLDGEPVSGSLFDFGLHFFHNAQRLLEKGSGPYFYLPKLENHLEARLWNDVFDFAQDELHIPRGSVKATVLIETILAAFEMDEILYELRGHIAGLNAGRWDYIFSTIKKFNADPHFVFPDRSQITMTVPFMRAYTGLLVKTCHAHGAHAIGGMAAFIPSRKDPEVNEAALAKVREDKLRESADGFDGTWVAHPDLVPVAKEVFDSVLGRNPHQKSRLREQVKVTAADLLDFDVPGGQVSEQGLRLNINVGLQYLDAWLNGIGAAGIHNLMEDAATAEISRAQVWQWLHHLSYLADGRPVSFGLYEKLCTQEVEKIRASYEQAGYESDMLDTAILLFDRLVTRPQFTEFLTLEAYEHLD